VEHNPEDNFARSSYFRAFQARRMRDARRSVVELSRRAGAAVETAVPGTDADSEPGAGADRIPSPVESGLERNPGPRPDDGHGLTLAIADLLRRGYAVAAVRLFEESQERGILPDWPTCDRVAATLLHLGRPAEARRIWEQQETDAPSPSLRLARIASAALAELDYPTAETTYHAALELDPGQGEAWFGLALLHLQRGDAGAALSAARRGRSPSLTPAQDAFLQVVEALAAPYAPLR
jgi:tetratricopeptide (TPR) repeat protein